jgi:hypothetical protein
MEPSEVVPSSDYFEPSDAVTEYLEWWKNPIPKKIKKTYECSVWDSSCYVKVSSEYGEHYTAPFEPPKKWRCNKANNCEMTNGLGISGISKDYCHAVHYGPGTVKSPAFMVVVGTSERTFAGSSERFEMTPDIRVAPLVLMDWDRETPYLKSLDALRKNGAQAESLYADYLQWKSKYANSSAFYFDVADFFFRENMH